MSLSGLPPAPGSAPIRYPKIDPTQPTYVQPEFNAWFAASEPDRVSGAWARGLDAPATGGPQLGLQADSRAATATTQAASPPPPVQSIGGNVVTAPPEWNAPVETGERTIMRSPYPVDTSAPAEDAPAPAAAGGGPSLLLIALGIGAAWLAWSYFARG